MLISFSEKIFNSIIHKINSRFNLPFFKNILIGPNFNWFNFDHHHLTAIALLKGIQLIFLENTCEQTKTDSDLSYNSKIIFDTHYKGINLYEVTQYQICVDLQVFINDVDISNPHHLAIIKKWYCKATDFIDYVLPLFHSTKPKKAIILQGYLYDHAIIRWICIQKDIEVVAVENTFNKDKIVWDNISGISVNKNLSSNYFWKYKNQINPKDAQDYAKNFIEQIKSYKQPEHKSPNKQMSPSRSKSILFIGQVYSDASVIFGINDFHSPVSIIKELVNYCSHQKYKLFIKLHPKELSGYDINNCKYNKLTHRVIKASPSLYNAIKENENIIYDHNNIFDTYSMIRTADICVTINSQAGLESLLLGKKLITCGNTFYDCLNSLYTAQNRHTLIALLDYLLETPTSDINMDELYSFFYIFNNKYCINKSEKSLSTLF